MNTHCTKLRQTEQEIILYMCVCAEIIAASTPISLCSKNKPKINVPRYT